MSESLNAFLTALASTVTYQRGMPAYIRIVHLETSDYWLIDVLLAGEELRKLLSVSNQHALEAVRQVNISCLPDTKRCRPRSCTLLGSESMANI